MLGDNILTTLMYRLSGNLGASTFWKPQGLSSPVKELPYLINDSSFVCT